MDLNIEILNVYIGRRYLENSIFKWFEFCLLQKSLLWLVKTNWFFENHVGSWKNHEKLLLKSENKVIEKCLKKIIFFIQLWIFMSFWSTYTILKKPETKFFCHKKAMPLPWDISNRVGLGQLDCHLPEEIFFVSLNSNASLVFSNALRLS